MCLNCSEHFFRIPFAMQVSKTTGDERSIVYKCKSNMRPGEACFYFKYTGKYYTVRPQLKGELKLVVIAQDEDPKETLAQQYLWHTEDHV